MTARLWLSNNPPSRRKGRGGVPLLHKGGKGTAMPSGSLFSRRGRCLSGP